MKKVKVISYENIKNKMLEKHNRIGATDQEKVDELTVLCAVQSVPVFDAYIDDVSDEVEL